jgi:hypothetical protein
MVRLGGAKEKSTIETEADPPAGTHVAVALGTIEVAVELGATVVAVRVALGGTAVGEPGTDVGVGVPCATELTAASASTLP